MERAVFLNETKALAKAQELAVHTQHAWTRTVRKRGEIIGWEGWYTSANNTTQAVMEKDV